MFRELVPHTLNGINNVLMMSNQLEKKADIRVGYYVHVVFMLDDSMRGDLVNNNSLLPLEATLIIPSNARYYAGLHNAVTIQRERNILLNKVIFPFTTSEQAIELFVGKS